MSPRALFDSKYPAAKLITYDPVSYYAVAEGTENVMGAEVIPSYNFDKAEVIVAIGADFLANWLSPIEYAKQYGENRITWQPDPNTRIALVIRPVPIEPGWFVASGRNMREVEIREAKLAALVSLALIAILGVTFFIALLKLFAQKGKEM